MLKNSEIRENPGDLLVQEALAEELHEGNNDPSLVVPGWGMMINLAAPTRSRATSHAG
jgi:hypothetical protein